MAAEQSPYSGPPLNVETWIDRGSPGNWLTGKGATGDVAHFEINHDPWAEEQWVKEYAEGRTAFQEPRIEAARSFTEQDKPAEAVISARIAKEIPWRGRAFMYNQGAVVRALGMEDYVDEEKVKRLSQGDYKGMERVWADLDRMGSAMDKAFDNPYEVKQELDSITAKGREAIKGKEVEAWTAAANLFGEKGDLNAAGVAAIELGGAYEGQGQTEDALRAFVAAGNLLKHRLNVVYSQGDPSRHTAEVDVLSAHLVEAQLGVLRIMQTRDKVKDEDKELLKAAVYDLDDYGASQRTVMEGYRILARSSHFGEKRFYKKEAAGIAGNLAVAAFFEENPGSVLMGGPEPRYDRSHLRPPVNLPATSSAQ